MSMYLKRQDGEVKVWICEDCLTTRYTSKEVDSVECDCMLTDSISDVVPMVDWDAVRSETTLQQWRSTKRNER